MNAAIYRKADFKPVFCPSRPTMGNIIIKLYIILHIDSFFLDAKI